MNQNYFFRLKIPFSVKISKMNEQATNGKLKRNVRLDSGNNVFFMNKITQSGETITACPLTHELATGTLQFSPFGL